MSLQVFTDRLLTSSMRTLIIIGQLLRRFICAKGKASLKANNDALMSVHVTSAGGSLHEAIARKAIRRQRRATPYAENALCDNGSCEEPILSNSKRNETFIIKPSA